MARPPADINWSEVDKLLEAGCTGTEIAGYIGIHPETLYRRCEEDNKIGFTGYSAEKHAKGETLLRAKQFSEAMKGDRGMLIWLGKNRLKQSDKQDIQHNGHAIVQVVNYSDKPAGQWKSDEKEKKSGG